MSDARIIRIKSRLSSAIGRGGITAKEAIARADAAVEGIRQTLVDAIDAILAEMEVRFGESSPDGSEGDYEALYALASNIIDASACLNGSLIDKAAYALCDMVDLSAERGVWDRQTVEVHIMVLRLLRNGGPDMLPARRRRVVEGLRLVTAKRIGDVEAARTAKAAKSAKGV